MEENTRKILYFFIGVILPLILIIVSFIPGINNILLTMMALVWLGFAIFIINPIND